MKFHEDIFNGFHVKYKHAFVTELLLNKFKGKKLKKYILKELWLLCSARRHMVLNTCMNFYEHILNDIAVSKDGVIKLLKGLNPSKALGPDELSPRVLKELATELGPIFAHLFQQSIDTGEIPKEWSLANICPLFKKSDRSLACNYRPVSLTCVPCKLLEHIVYSNIMAHLDEYKLLSDRRHAFRKGHSCETQLTTVINDWAKILDNRGQVDTFIFWKGI